MAAPSPVRVKLLFDYPPPAIPESCMFWLLLDAKRCRVVTDLASIIRHKYMDGQGGGISLYVEDCLLPPGESILVIRDNDSIRVKWDGAAIERNQEAETCNDGAQNKSKKRHWKKSEDECDSGHKRKKQKSSSTQVDLKSGKDGGIRDKRKPSPPMECNASDPEELRESGRKTHKGKRTKKKSEAPIENPPDKHSRKCPPQASNKALKLSWKRQTSSSDSSDTSSCSDQPTPTTQQKPQSSAKRQNQAATRESVTHSVSPKAVNGISSTKNKKADAPISSSDMDTAVGGNETLICPVPPEDLSTHIQQHSQSPTSDSAESIELVIKKSNASLSSLTDNRVAGVSDKLSPNVSGRGRGRGEDFSWRGQRGRWFRGQGNNSNRGRGRGDSSNVFYKYNTEKEKQQQLEESATNVSIIIQNPQETMKRDYSSLPLLAAAPQVGKLIAFKLLEVSENYTPEVSEYKEGKILSFDPVTKQIEMEIISQQTMRKPGKFDVVYQSEDGEDIVEYAVPQESKVMLNWNTLIEPRLLMEKESQVQC
uniref:Coilin n=1 Tax=Xenopus laevis TaxID=8355 RepID=COIL_XENLA|nr:RecName: Full=Coilin; AltName: Full=Sphere organelles protein SPH-1; Short=Sphere protein 1 [Xenopus laevis]AAH72777.1 LOC397940 protein [Xenopus laevis]